MECKVFNVLVVEDNSGDYALVEDILTDQPDDFMLLRAKNFEDAQNILLRGRYRFDIILLDISLPDKTGMPLINEVLSLSNNAPVIILTGNTDIEFSVRSLSIGVSDYILKHDLTPNMLYKSIIYSIERKKSTLALIASEQRYGELFHLSPLPMWVVNLDTMQFMDINEATISHYGYSREEFLNMTLEDITLTDELADKEIAAGGHKESPENSRQRVATHIKKNGDLINVELQVSQISYRGVPSSVIVAKDVTERMNYIKAMEAQNARLLEISWIQSHVVRAPLSRIIGLIPLIETAIEAEGDEETRRMLKYIAFSANELDDIIMDITEKTKTSDAGRVAQLRSNTVLKKVS